jgi:hypothetical protein
LAIVQIYQSQSIRYIDCYQNFWDQWCLAEEDDASRKILGMIKKESSSGAASVCSSTTSATVPPPTVKSSRWSPTTAPNSTRIGATSNGNADHSFEQYLVDNDIQHTLCAVGQPQSNSKIERYFQTYDNHRWRFDSLEDFLEYYNQQRPHHSLRYDDVETPTEAFDRLLATAEDAHEVAVADGGEYDMK